MPQRPLQVVCGPMCAYENSKKEIKKIEGIKWKETKRKWLDRNKTLTEYRAEAREMFQKFIRIRDKDLPCISCGATQSRVWHGGHYLKAEIYTGLIFDEDNCHKQCLKCNYYQDGNELNYRTGLIKKIGAIRLLDLESKKGISRLYRFTKFELLNIKNHYKQRIKDV